MTSEPNPDLPEDEKQLCLNCAAPNEPSANFCTKCGAPLTPYATFGPFESVFAEGFIYRAASERPQKLVTVLGMWFIFGLFALTGIPLIAMWRSVGLIFAAIGVGLTAVSIAIIWKTTRNYLTRKKPDERNAA
jgi:hypothetical protein